MKRMLGEYATVLRECRRTYKTTGTVTPSSRFLARALSRYVRDGNSQPTGRRILEVGPGTGPVTRWIIDALGEQDRLDLVELNDTFVATLRRRFERDAPFRAVAGRTRILHRPVQELVGEPPYDLIISGLPLNNFEVDEVEQILDVLRRLVAPGGVVSFFEYIAIRKAKAAVSGRAQRQRLRGVARVVGDFLRQGEIRRDWILPNVPPAWVHHVRPHPAM